MKEVWEEVFAGKPYTTHTLAISGASILLLPVKLSLSRSASFAGNASLGGACCLLG